jgi:Zn-dependent peptidase ImmA (M78 family)
MEAIQNWIRDYLVDQGNERLPFVGFCDQKRQIEEIVAAVRKSTTMEEDWFVHSADTAGSLKLLHPRFKNTGILILKNDIVGQNTHRPLDVSEFRAFTLLDGYAPLIFINSRDSTSSQLFSLTHEIAHVA